MRWLQELGRSSWFTLTTLTRVRIARVRLAWVRIAWVRLAWVRIASFSIASFSIASFSIASISAGASAQWTLPPGQILTSASFEGQFADREYFGLDGEEGGARDFPLNGRYYGASLNVGTRIGLSEGFEIEAQFPFRLVSFTADPVILLEQPADATGSGLDFYQENTLALAQTNAGLADVRLAARYRWLAAPILLTTEVEAKIPGGYDGPVGTFGDQPATAQEFLSDVARFVQPENVRDDVTLGDGQVDLTLNQLFGVAFPSRTFVAGDIGYSLRLGGAADQIVGSLRAGQLLGDLVLLFVRGSFAYSVEQGDPIGVSVAAVDPSVPARDYGGTSNLLLREVRLRRDFVQVSGGAILRLDDTTELKFSYSRIVWGRNLSQINSVTVGFSGRTTLFEVGRNITPPAEEPPEETPPARPEDDAAFIEAPGAEPLAEEPLAEEPLLEEALPEEVLLEEAPHEDAAREEPVPEGPPLERRPDARLSPSSDAPPSAEPR